MGRVDQGSDMDLVEAEADAEVETEDEDVAMLNRIHSRRVSRLSAALSLRSVGRQQDSLLTGCEEPRCGFYS